MQQLTEVINPISAYLILGLAAAFIVVLIMLISVFGKLKALGKKRFATLEEGRVGDIVDCLSDHAQKLEEILAHLEKIDNNQASMEKELSFCIKNVGMARFDAYSDVGGQQSCAMALTDSHKNGIVLSNLYGRQDSRIYIKMLKDGNAERPLSDEEIKALESSNNEAK